jgi:hypothetical protein
MTECHTESLEEPVNHLLSEDVTDAAMESTGICGEPLRAKPEEAGKGNSDQSVAVQKARHQDGRQGQRPAAPVSFGRFVPQIAHCNRKLARIA